MKAQRFLVMLTLTASSALLVGLPDTATANRGNDAETIRMLDDCDPKTFNKALDDPTACVGDGNTTFNEFLEELQDGGDGHWKNNPQRTEVDSGEGLHLVNRGGEFHTFTKVDRFADGGCVPKLNDPLGLPTRDDAFCFAAFTDPSTAVPAGEERQLSAAHLDPGHNHFQCMIHPWMQTTVVREHVH